MPAINLRVTAPICAFRRPYAREYLETERVAPPSTIYGFLLSLVGEEDRTRFIGTRLAIAMLSEPKVSTVLRTTWRIKERKTPPGKGANRKPDFQELLTGVEVAVWVADGPLAGRLRLCAGQPGAIARFGGLSLGESRDLVNEICFEPDLTGREGRWLVRDPKGRLPLTLWVDHVGSKGTRWEQFAIQNGSLAAPPAEDPRWITIEPPLAVAKAKPSGRKKRTGGKE